MIKLVAFLGNYGSEYEKTRHNVAWQFASQLPFYNRLNFQNKFKGDYAVVETSVLAHWFAETGMYSKKDGSDPIVPEGSPDKIYFLKPLTYMNLSGESVGELARFYKILPEEILVVHDELELPLGTVSLKWSGGLGGLRRLLPLLSSFRHLLFATMNGISEDLASESNTSQHNPAPISPKNAQWLFEYFRNRALRSKVLS